MAEDDPVEDLHGSLNMAMMSASRVAETLLRASQADAVRREDEARRAAEQAHQRYEAQARTAEQFYRRAATSDFVRSEPLDAVVNGWRGAQEWAQLDPERFGGHAERFTEAIRDVHGVDLGDERSGPAALERLREQVREQGGVDVELEQERQEDGVDREAEPGLAAGLEYDSDDARKARAEQIDRSDFHAETKAALKIADNQNGRDPAEAATAGAKKKSRAAARATSRERTPAGRGR